GPDRHDPEHGSRLGPLGPCLEEAVGDLVDGAVPAGGEDGRRTGERGLTGQIDGLTGKIGLADHEGDAARTQLALDLRAKAPARPAARVRIENHQRRWVHEHVIRVSASVKDPGWYVFAG